MGIEPTPFARQANTLTDKRYTPKCLLGFEPRTFVSVAQRAIRYATSTGHPEKFRYSLKKR